MKRPVLKVGSKLKADVEVLQTALRSLGAYKAEVDGDFGPLTDTGVRFLQDKAGLEVDGIVGSLTWAEIERQLPVGETSKPESKFPGVLDDFRGDSDWIHRKEGHGYTAYWPTGASGVTIDPGVDLGYLSGDLRDIFVAVYEDILTPEQVKACLSVQGVTGPEAEDLLKDSNDPRAIVLRTIRISRAEAEEIFPVVLDPYWDKIKVRFPHLLDADVPGEVHTVFASLAYNRGVYNTELGPLAGPLNRKDFRSLGNMVRRMQQSHRSPGIPIRRRAEGDLILSVA